MKEDQIIASVLLIMICILAGVVTAQVSSTTTLTGGAVVNVLSEPVDLTTVLIIILIAGLFASLSLGLYMRQSAFQKKADYSSEKDKLKKYVSTSLAHGWPEEQIKDAMQKAGWTEDDINDACQGL